MAKKQDAKGFAMKRRKRRQWITFLRMVRYGANNFSRNAWLTIAATAVMTITLLIIFITVAARSTLVSSVDKVSDSVDISIYLATDTKKADADGLMRDISSLKSVKSVGYLSSSDARAKYAREHASSSSDLEALNEATNKFPATIRVKLNDINNTAELRSFVDTNTTLKKHLNETYPPSFAGPKQKVIQRIGSWVSFADKVGIVASAIFIIISSLIVFNTIRMAIFNRKEEIQMMKLIGADRSFIRGPFVVEAVVYGFIAAVLATGIGTAMLYASKSGLERNDVAIGPTIDIVTTYIGFILLAMILIGALIAVVSSLLATRRYLKI